MSADFSCPDCISDVIYKAGMRGESAKYVTSQPFCALHWQRPIRQGWVRRSSNGKQTKQKVLNILYTYSWNNQTQLADFGFFVPRIVCFQANFRLVNMVLNVHRNHKAY